MYWSNNPNKDMGDDYNHSTFVDLVLSGLFGLRGGQDDTSVEINPLIPSTVAHCAVDHVSYHGHTLAVVWDQDGTHYKKGKGLMIIVDGKVAASSPAIGRLRAALG